MLMTWAEEQKNVAAYALHDSQEAFEKILCFFLPLIRSIANRTVWNRSDYDDLMQLGTIALSQAIRKFDPSRGNRLAPFAEKLIRSEMTRYRRANFGPVRIGAASKIWKAYRRLPRAIDGLRQLGRDPYDASAIDHYAQIFVLDQDTVKSLIATYQAGAHAAVPITGAEWEYTEAAHQELWVDGGHSQVERRLDHGQLIEKIVGRMHEIFSGTTLQAVMAIFKSDLGSEDYAVIAKQYGFSLAKLHAIKRKAFAEAKDMLGNELDVAPDSL